MFMQLTYSFGLFQYYSGQDADISVLLDGICASEVAGADHYESYANNEVHCG